MILLEHVHTGEGVVVESLDGYTLVEWRVVARDVSGYEGKRWNAAAQAFEDVPISDAARLDAALLSDARWLALREATPEQVVAYLNSSETSLTQVLAVLVLAVQRLQRRAGIDERSETPR